MKKLDIVKEWLAYAERDLASAEHLKKMHPLPLEIICYHCAQAAEKALKAYLISKDLDPPRTHDLRLLNRICNRYENFSELEQSCIELTAYGTQPRYPFGIEISEHDMEKALLNAEKVLVFVREKLEEP